METYIEPALNVLSVLQMTPKATTWIAECLEDYCENMRTPICSCESEKEFLMEHEIIKNKAVSRFKTNWSCTYESNEFLAEFLGKLEQDVEVIFDELFELFEFLLKSYDVETYVVKPAFRHYYHEKMENKIKKQFVYPEILYSWHKQVSQVTTDFYKNSKPLKKMQISVLQQTLENSFEKYVDQNTMYLNYEQNSVPAVGIDLGTTYCCIAVFYKGKISVIPSVEGWGTTASYLFINRTGQNIVGDQAKTTNPKHTVYDTKRILGRSFHDEQLQNDMSFWPFTVIKGEKGPVIQIGETEYSPEKVVSILLRELVKQAEKHLSLRFFRAVVTVPAYFTKEQRKATKDAVEMAELELLQMLDESTAAVLAYNLEGFHEDTRKVIILDFGGSTFDVSVLQIDGNKIRVLNNDGDTNLGGQDFDKAMMEYCYSEFKKQHSVDPFPEKDSSQIQEKCSAKRMLQMCCENGKKELSYSPSTVISINAFFNAKDLNVTVTRQKFEELNAASFKKALEIVERSLIQVGLSKTQIDDIFLIGGSVRIPKVFQMLEKYFGRKALNPKVDPVEAVARGAAVKAALLNGGIAMKELPFGSNVDTIPNIL